MGQKVSMPACVTGGGCRRIRVKTPCGKYEEVNSPCVASKVMGKHPEHLVVHCSLVNGNEVEITIISPNQPLLPGVPYMLYPKVETNGVPGEEDCNLPNSICVSMKDRQLTFRNSHSPKSYPAKKGGSRKSFDKSASPPQRGTRQSFDKAASSPQLMMR